MRDAHRGYDAAIGNVRAFVAAKFTLFGATLQDLPTAPFGITQADQMYRVLQEMAHKDANQGMAEQAGCIHKALDDIKQRTGKLMGELIERHGTPDILPMGKIPTSATAEPSLTGATASAPARTSDSSDWFTRYRRLLELRLSHLALHNSEASCCLTLAASRISKLVSLRFSKFGRDPDHLAVSPPPALPEQAYRALQEMAPRSGDLLNRLAIHQSLYDIDQATFREIQEAIEKHGVPQVPLGASVEPIDSVDIPPGSLAQQFDSFAELRELSDRCKIFSERSDKTAVKDCRAVLARISARVRNVFEKYGGRDKDLQKFGKRITKPEQMYVRLRKLARESSNSGEKMQAFQICKALDEIKKHIVDSMDGLIAMHEVPDDPSTGETLLPATAEQTPTVETTPAPAGTSVPFDMPTAYRRLYQLWCHYQDFGNDVARSRVYQAMRRISNRVWHGFRDLHGNVNALPESDLSSKAPLAYEALQDMALKTDDKLKALQIRRRLEDFDRLTSHVLNELTGLPGFSEITVSETVGTGRGTPGPIASTSGSAAAQPSATRVDITPEGGAHSPLGSHPNESLAPTGISEFRTGLQRAGESHNPPHGTATGDACDWLASPRWLTDVDSPPQLQGSDQVAATVARAAFEFLAGAEAESQPVPPLSTAFGVWNEPMRAPVMPTQVPPDGQSDGQSHGSLSFASLPTGAGEDPVARRRQIVYRFKDIAAMHEANAAFEEGRLRTLGFSDQRWRELRGKLLQIHMAAQLGPVAGADIEFLDWNALEALAQILDTPADFP